MKFVKNADDTYNGYHVQFTSGTNDGITRIVDDYTGSTKTLTLRSAATGQVATAVTYELWVYDDVNLEDAELHAHLTAGDGDSEREADEERADADGCFNHASPRL